MTCVGAKTYGCQNRRERIHKIREQRLTALGQQLCFSAAAAIVPGLGTTFHRPWRDRLSQVGTNFPAFFVLVAPRGRRECPRPQFRAVPAFFQVCRAGHTAVSAGPRIPDPGPCNTWVQIIGVETSLWPSGSCAVRMSCDPAPLNPCRRDPVFRDPWYIGRSYMRTIPNTTWLAIRHEYQTTGTTCARLGEKYGISPCTVSNRCKVEKWRHGRPRRKSKAAPGEDQLGPESFRTPAQWLAWRVRRDAAEWFDRIDEAYAEEVKYDRIEAIAKLLPCPARSTGQDLM